MTEYLTSLILRPARSHAAGAVSHCWGDDSNAAVLPPELKVDVRGKRMAGVINRKIAHSHATL
jgi:hypothetical protein